jgi:uncharacterized cupin superfamily protein
VRCRQRRRSKIGPDRRSRTLLVVSGTPTLRHPDGEEQLEPLDLVFFPAGPDGAHLVRNNSESTARVAMFSSSVATFGAVDDGAPWTAGV